MDKAVAGLRSCAFATAVALSASCSLIVDAKLEGRDAGGSVPGDLGPPADHGAGRPSVDLRLQTPTAYVGEPVVVQVAVSGFALVPAAKGRRATPGEGRFRLTLEGALLDAPVLVHEGTEPEVKFVVGPPLVPDLPPAVYELVVVLVQNDGTPVQPEVRDAEPLAVCTREPMVPQPDQCPTSPGPALCAPQEECEPVCPAGSCASCYFVPECVSVAPCVRFTLIEPVHWVGRGAAHVAVEVGPGVELVDPLAPEPQPPPSGLPTAYLRVSLRGAGGVDVEVLYEGAAPEFDIEVPPVPDGFYDLTVALISAATGVDEAPLAEACWPVLVGAMDEPALPQR